LADNAKALRKNDQNDGFFRSEVNRRNAIFARNGKNTSRAQWLDAA
jgi:hypothetical protein